MSTGNIQDLQLTLTLTFLLQGLFLLCFFQLCRTLPTAPTVKRMHARTPPLGVGLGQHTGFRVLIMLGTGLVLGLENI